MEPIDQIRRFARLTPGLEEELRSLMREYHFRKGDFIRGKKNLTAYAYYISSGAARVFHTIGGKEHTFSFAFEDEFIMISRHVLQSLPETVSIQFLEPTTVTFIPNLKVKNILVESKTVIETAALLFVITGLMQYTSFVEERIWVMQSLSADERYQWALKRYPRLAECANLTQIASFLGITKETLYRIRSGKYRSGLNKPTANT